MDNIATQHYDNAVRCIIKGMKVMAHFSKNLEPPKVFITALIDILFALLI
jgi:hypothetical protein